jgi:cell division ATPase FtsA
MADEIITGLDIGSHTIRVAVGKWFQLIRTRIRCISSVLLKYLLRV